MINRRAFFQALAGVPAAAAVVAKAAPLDLQELSEALRKDYARAFCALGYDSVPTEVIVTDGRVRLFGGRVANVSRSTP